jgi:hypothetical protein
MKHASIFILFSSLVILIIGYFAYHEIIYPSMLNNGSQEQNLLLSNDQKVTLVKRKEQTGIYSLEVEIEPNEYNYSIAFCEGPKVIFEAGVKKGVGFVYSTDWYSDTCNLIIIPNKQAQDSVLLTYRFLGLNH